MVLSAFVWGKNNFKTGVLWVWAGVSLRVDLRSQVFEITQDLPGSWL